MAHVTVLLVLVASLLSALPPSCCLLPRHSSTWASCNVTQTRVFSAGEGGYYCFRIPALLFTSRGTLLAFAEGRGQDSGSCDDHGDVHIVLKRSSDSGRTWSNLTIVYREDAHTIGKVSTCSTLGRSIRRNLVAAG